MSTGNVVVSQDAPAKNNLWIQPKGTARFWNGSIWKTIIGGGGSGDYLTREAADELYQPLSGMGSYLTKTEATNTYLSIAFFERLFKAYNGSDIIHPNDTTSTIDSIKAMFGFWTEQYISALGQNSSSSGGGGGLDIEMLWQCLRSDDGGLLDETPKIYATLLGNNLSENKFLKYIGNNYATWTSLSISDINSLENTLSNKQDKLPTSGNIIGNYYINISGNAATATSAVTATTANKLSTVSKTAWGQTFWTSGGVPESISGDMSNVGNIISSGNKTKNIGESNHIWNTLYVDKIQIGNAIISFDNRSGYNMIKVDAVEGTTFNGLYTTGALSALGANPISGGGGGSGSGLDITTLWNELRYSNYLSTSWSEGDDKIIERNFLPLNGISALSSPNTRTFYAPTSAGTNGYILKSNGSGAPSWLNILPIANGGTSATTRLGALQNLTNENVGTSAQYFLTITENWGKGGYTSVANVKSVLGLGSNAYTSTAYLPLSGGTMTGLLKIKSGLGIENDDGNGMLCYNPSSWSYVTSSQWGVGANTCQGVIRSNNTNLLHSRGNGTLSTILDGGNSYIDGGKGYILDTEITTISGNAATATTASKLGTSNVGSLTNPIYLSSGTATACTYSLSSTVNAGTANYLAYYSGTNAISQANPTAYLYHNSTTTECLMFHQISGTNKDYIGYNSTYGSLWYNYVGQKAIQINNNGNVRIGSLSSTDSGHQLYVNGTSYLNGTTYNNGDLVLSPGSTGIYLTGTGISWHNASNTFVSNQMTFDGTNVGIGTNSPAYKLDVAGKIYATDVIRSQAYSISNNMASFVWDKNGTNYTGVGSCNTADTIHFGPCNASGTWVSNYNQNWEFQGNVYALGGVTALATISSDKRLKKNIKSFNAIEIVEKLKPIQFEWNNKAKKYNENFKDGKNYGLIAQDSDGIIDDLVFDLPDGKGYKGVRYEKLIPILLQAIKEQNEKIENLEYEINVLKGVYK